jgi:acetyltransferase
LRYTRIFYSMSVPRIYDSCFFARIVELSAAEAHKLSHLDYSHEMAFIALDEDTGQMLGLVRLKDELDEKTAEFAILVRSRMGSAGC